MTTAKSSSIIQINLKRHFYKDDDRGWTYSTHGRHTKWVLNLVVKRPLLDSSRRLEDNIKIHLKVLGYDEVNWIDLFQFEDF
jgi:hypothetical protein